MTHVVNLLPWRDLRRRQRLRFILLIATGIMLLGLMILQVCRTVRLQHLARRHSTRRPTQRCSPRSNSASFQCARRGSSTSVIVNSNGVERRSPPGNPAAGARGGPARSGMADAAGVPGGAPDAGWPGPQFAGAGRSGGFSGQRHGIRTG